MRPPARIVSNRHPRTRSLLVLCLCLLCAGCRSLRPASPPVVTLLKLPPASLGGNTEKAVIAGLVTGVRPGQQIVIYSHTDQWYVQPLTATPFTAVDATGRWENNIHLGLEYAALLVEPGYAPAGKILQLPPLGHGVVAIARAGADRVGTLPPAKVIHFSGYDWTTRKMENPRNGRWNIYEPDNVWTDDKGSLHLRITRRNGVWTCAQVALTRSLGFGTYRFTVRDVSRFGLLPAFSVYTYDDHAPGDNRRELAVEISHWGEPGNKNAQFVVQPYYVSENVARFTAPPGSIINAFRWQPDRADFTSHRVLPSGAAGALIAEHTFTSLIPTPGSESIHLNLSIPSGHPGEPTETEVVLDRFEYLP